MYSFVFCTDGATFWTCLWVWMLISQQSACFVKTNKVAGGGGGHGAGRLEFMIYHIQQ